MGGTGQIRTNDTYLTWLLYHQNLLLLCFFSLLSLIISHHYHYLLRPPRRFSRKQSKLVRTTNNQRLLLFPETLLSWFLVKVRGTYYIPYLMLSQNHLINGRSVCVRVATRSARNQQYLLARAPSARQKECILRSGGSLEATFCYF